MPATSSLVVEWHDLTDPRVLLGIDVVAHAASSQDLVYDREGNPLSFMGIPLTRSLLCSSCGTAIGWSTDSYSCPGCGGRELGKFEANRHWVVSVCRANSGTNVMRKHAVNWHCHRAAGVTSKGWERGMKTGMTFRSPTQSRTRKEVRGRLCVAPSSWHRATASYKVAHFFLQ